MIKNNSVFYDAEVYIKMMQKCT